MRTIIAAALAGLFVAGQMLADPTPEERYAAARKILEKDCSTACGLGIGDDPAELKALDAMWDASEDWTLTFLRLHPNLTAAALKARLTRKSPMLFEEARIGPTAVAQLAPGLLAFSLDWGESGTVFLAAKRNGTWTVAWDARKAETGSFAALEAWHSDQAQPDCHDDAGHFRCGPLYGAAIPLKPDAEGRVRFGLIGTYAQGAGFTVTSQISFWRWNGRTATPLFASTYAHEEDDVIRGRSATDTVVVRVKEDYRSFEACGSCNGRQVDRTFRVRPDRIEDGGKRLVHPEADFVDQVYDRLDRHLPVKNMAAPKVAAEMSANVPSRGDFITKRSQVCLFSDAFDNFVVQFHVARRAHGYFIDHLVKVPEPKGTDACAQPSVK